MMYAWGRFIDHDINLTLSDNVNHVDISMPAGDPTLSGSIALARPVIDPLTGAAGKPAVTPAGLDRRPALQPGASHRHGGDRVHHPTDAFVFYERLSGQDGDGLLENPNSPQLVVGSNGPDTLVGGTKGDLLVAGSGRQIPTGAAGGDIFIVGKNNVDAVITDLRSARTSRSSRTLVCQQLRQSGSSMRVVVQMSISAVPRYRSSGFGRAISSSAT